MGGAVISKSLICYFNLIFCSWVGLCSLPVVWPEAKLLIQGSTRDSWTSLLWEYCSFLLAPGAHKVLFVPLKSLFLKSCGSSVIKSHWPPNSNSLGASLIAGVVRNLPVMQETPVGFLVWEDLLEKG